MLIRNMDEQIWCIHCRVALVAMLCTRGAQPSNAGLWSAFIVRTIRASHGIFDEKTFGFLGFGTKQQLSHAITCRNYTSSSNIHYNFSFLKVSFLGFYFPTLQICDGRASDEGNLRSERPVSFPYLLKSASSGLYLIAIMQYNSRCWRKIYCRRIVP